jgi:hypothetical protein
MYKKDIIKKYKINNNELDKIIEEYGKTKEHNFNNFFKDFDSYDNRFNKVNCIENLIYKFENETEFHELKNNIKTT